MTVSIPPIPPIPQNPTPEDLYRILTAMKTAFEVREGVTAAGTNSRFTTIQDLVGAGVLADGDVT